MSHDIYDIWQTEVEKVGATFWVRDENGQAVKVRVTEFRENEDGSRTMRFEKVDENDRD